MIYQHTKVNTRITYYYSIAAGATAAMSMSVYEPHEVKTQNGEAPLGLPTPSFNVEVAVSFETLAAFPS